eukprot:4045241-Lingulodinium_polyedra.AAC.1
MAPSLDHGGNPFLAPPENRESHRLVQAVGLAQGCSCPSGFAHERVVGKPLVLECPFAPTDTESEVGGHGYVL